MKVAISGATGFIGRHLVQSLLADGHTVFALTRNKQQAAARIPERVTLVQWQSRDDDEWPDRVAGCDAFVNLAGENLSSGRWTEQKKRALMESRLEAIRRIGVILSRRDTAGQAPATVIQASAIGYYGPRGEEPLSENASRGSGYLAEIAERCEREIGSVAGRIARVVLIRTGIVLGRESGILPRLFTPLRLGFGGYPGNGQQWLSWIHIDDEVRAIRFLLDHAELGGPFNLTAPGALPIGDFVRLGGRILHRPVWVPLPAPFLRILFGEMADEALLTGQHVIPERLGEYGFRFDHPIAESALTALLSGA